MGSIVPTMTIRDSGGGIKQPAMAANQWLLWMIETKLFINNYYNMLTTQYILPGDTVNVNSGGVSHTIPVDRVTSFVNTDYETVVGEAPPGARSGWCRPMTGTPGKRLPPMPEDAIAPGTRSYI